MKSSVTGKPSQKSLWLFVLALFCYSCFSVCHAATIPEDNLPELPVLKNIAALPVQYQFRHEATPELSQVFDVINGEFSKVVQATGRFLVINDEVVKNLWRSVSGRKQLVQQFESDAFISLSITVEEDVARYDVRIMSPDFDSTYLIETDTVSLSWLLTNTQETIKNHLEGCVFRLVNRIPVDVFVTSMQGPYITLSGGQSQNIFIGDSVTLFNTFVKSKHPANGSWISYQQRQIAVAKIIEIKENSSVAQLVSIQIEDGLKIGSGAKITALNSRKKFAREDLKQDFRLAGGPTIITADKAVAPIMRPESRRPDPQKELPAQTRQLLSEVEEDKNEENEKAPAAAQPPVPEASPVEKQVNEKAPVEKQVNEKAPVEKQVNEKAPVEKQVTAEEEPQNEIQTDAAVRKEPEKAAESAPATGSDASSFERMLASVKDVHGTLGHRMFSTSGTAKAASDVPLYLLNHADISAVLPFPEKMPLEIHGELGFGPTAHGSFVSFLGRARLNFIESLRIRPLGLEKLSLGPSVSFQTLSISSERFGGYDLLQLGGYIKAAGQTQMGEDQLEWVADFSVLPFSMGQAGLGGRKYDIDSTSDVTLKGTLYLPKDAGSALQWGAALGLQSSSYGAGSRSISTTAILLGLALK
jgi:hypothetical protein